MSNRRGYHDMDEYLAFFFSSNTPAIFLYLSLEL